MQTNVGTVGGTPTRRGVQSQFEVLPNRTPEEDLNDLVGGSIGPRRTRRTPNKRKKPSEVYRVLQDELDDDGKAILHAMFVWIRLLWWLLDSNKPPTCPTPAELAQFQRFFENEQALEGAASGDDPPLINPDLVSLPTRVELSRCDRLNAIAVNSLALPDWFLSKTRLTLAKFGLERWCVDLAAQPDSLYNKACEHVALETFRHGLLCGAFQHLKSPRRLADDRGLHLQVYHHVVFQYFMGKWVEEGKHGDGTLAKKNDHGVVLQRRLRLANCRYDFLKACGYPDRYLLLADPRATSDDEQVPGTKTFKIKRRPERSKPAEIWYRRMDTVMRQSSGFTSGKKIRQRFVPDIPEDSTTEKLPTGMPLDYFDPQFFCQLPPHARHAAIMGPAKQDRTKKRQGTAELKGELRLAFLEEPNLSLGLGTSEIRAMEQLSDADFFAQRREKVLPLYDLQFGTHMDTSHD
ncbi:hypothetical protein AAF712_009727 [Marasmius tenuissimus]|uniref:Uncharacterized protein n=1 Tax=Marasmius tenuissimus TaxID=585030 RepID=A0ABR2ZPX9_9AGAR